MDPLLIVVPTVVGIGMLFLIINERIGQVHITNEVRAARMGNRNSQALDATIPPEITSQAIMPIAEKAEKQEWDQRQYLAMAPSVPEIITERPFGVPRTLQSDVAVPAAQAGISGIVGALIGITVGILINTGIAYLALSGFVVGITLIWALSLWQSHRLLWIIERITRLDLDNDQQIGAPTGHKLLINPGQARAKTTRAQAETQKRIYVSDLLDFWTRCNMIGTSQRDHGIEAGSGAALRRYEEMRDILFNLGLAEWKNPQSHNAGWRVVGDLDHGAQILAQHVRDLYVPSSTIQYN